MDRAERERAKLDEDIVRFVACELECKCKVSFFSCTGVCTQYRVCVYARVRVCVYDLSCSWDLTTLGQQRRAVLVEMTVRQQHIDDQNENRRDCETTVGPGHT